MPMCRQNHNFLSKNAYYKETAACAYADQSAAAQGQNPLCLRHYSFFNLGDFYETIEIIYDLGLPLHSSAGDRMAFSL